VPKKIKKKEKDSEKERLRLKIKAYDYRLIDTTCSQIIDIIEGSGKKVIGPIPLPTEIKKYTVNRSTFVHKDSREQFELRVHTRLIDVLEPDQRLIESFSDINLPAGVEIEMKSA